MTLEEISRSNVHAVLALDVAEAQRAYYPRSNAYSIAEGLGGLGRVYDQDTANMAAQTRGFRSSIKRGQTLGNYQEVRARHLQERVRDFVGAWPEE